MAFALEAREQSRASIARVTAATLVLAAGAIHFAVAPEHFGESWQFGWFMAIAGAAQAADAVLLVVKPGRAVLLATSLGNLAIVGIFVWAYTVGLPFGPDPGQREQLTAVGLACTLAEGAVIAAAVALLPARRAVRKTVSY